MLQTFSMAKPGLTILYPRIIIDGMDYVSTKEASELTGYSIQYIQRLLRQGKIKAEKKGGMYWINLESVKEYKRKMDSLGSEKYSPHRED